MRRWQYFRTSAGTEGGGSDNDWKDKGGGVTGGDRVGLRGVKEAVVETERRRREGHGESRTGSRGEAGTEMIGLEV